jgi:hypothetical protein
MRERLESKIRIIGDNASGGSSIGDMRVSFEVSNEAHLSRPKRDIGYENFRDLGGQTDSLADFRTLVKDSVS